MQTAIQIACSPDDNYLQHCIAMLNSLFTNNAGNSFCIHVIKNGLNAQNQQIIKDYVLTHKHECKFYTVDASALTNAPTHAYVSLASYYRFFLSTVIDNTIEKILYLDSDIIVRTNIIDLWNTDITGYYAAAVKEPIDASHLATIGMPAGAAYFNAGILLVNLKKWREDGMMEQCVAFTQNHPERIIYWDQDVLNNLFNDNWKKLDPYWNVTHFYYRKGCDAAYFSLPEEKYNALKQSPGIVHFTGPHKPWIYNTEHPLKREYYKYLKGTPWASFKYINGPGAIQRTKTAVKRLTINLLGERNTEKLLVMIRKGN